MPGRRSFKSDESFLEKLATEAFVDIFAGSSPAGTAVTESICNLESGISNQAQRGASALPSVRNLPVENLATLWSRLQSHQLPADAPAVAILPFPAERCRSRSFQA